MIKNIIYITYKTIAKYGVHLFYRGITKVGFEHIPDKGTPFIYAVNHQNAFLDAVIVGSISPIPTYFMTRSDVFKPPFDWFLDALKMMPIYRIRDGYSSLSKNDAIFETCKNILEQNKAILIFPEGNHGLEYFLRPLTKGVARIALKSQQEISPSIKIVPVGLNYFNHFHSGNRLIIKYGEPLDMKDYMELFEEHPQKGYRKLMPDIAEAMKSTLIIDEEQSNYTEQKGIFNRANESLSFEDLKSNLNNKELTGKEPSRYPLLAFIGKMFGIFNWPPLALCDYIIKKKTSQSIFQASIRIAMGVLIFPKWLLLCFIIMLVMKGWLWAVGLLAIQIISLIIRRELVRLGRR